MTGLIGVDIDPRGVGHRRAYYRAGIEPHLVAGNAAEIADIGHDAFEPVDRVRIRRAVGGRPPARQFYLFGADRDADTGFCDWLVRLGHHDGSGVPGRDCQPAAFARFELPLEDVDVTDELGDPARRRLLIELPWRRHLFEAPSIH